MMGKAGRKKIKEEEKAKSGLHRDIHKKFPSIW
jgi:hypothetical protein